MKGIYIVWLTMLLMMASLASATITVNLPSSDQVVTGVIDINISTGYSRSMNCTITAGASNTDNTSITISLVNTTGNMSSLKLSYDTTGMQDSNNWRFETTTKCCNFSQDCVTLSTTRTFVVDNTIPSAISYTTPSSNSQDPRTTLNVSATLTSGTMTDCTLKVYKNGGLLTSNAGSVSDLSTECSLITVGYDDDYQYQLTFTDGRNSTSMAITTVTVARTGAAASVAAIMESQAAETQAAQVTARMGSGLRAFFIKLWDFIIFWD